jgi:hypothetical protein
MISRQGYGEVASYVKVQSIPCPRGVKEDNEKGINLLCHQPKYKLDHQNMSPLHIRSVKCIEQWLQAICVAELK